MKKFSALMSRIYVYRFFRLFPSWKQFETGSMKDFTAVINEFHNQVIEEVVENRYGVELPLRMGKLMIGAYRTEKRYPNMAFYSKSGEKTTFANNHTDGLQCKLLYFNQDRRYRLKDRRLWEFVPEKKFKSRISRAFSLDHNRYIVMPNRGKINSEANEFEQRDILERKIDKFLLTYNEFQS